MRAVIFVTDDKQAIRSAIMKRLTRKAITWWGMNPVKRCWRGFNTASPIWRCSI